jgi:hypothetical protein
VTGISDTIILRKLELTQERLRLKQLIKESSEKAEKSGFSEEEVVKLKRRPERSTNEGYSLH